MRYIYLILLLVVSHSSAGQDPLLSEVNRKYFEFGGSTAFSKDLRGSINISFIPISVGNFLLGLRYFNSIYKEEGFPDEGIFQTLDNYQLAIGGTFYIQNVGWTLTAGPAIIKYIKPENIDWE